MICLTSSFSRDYAFHTSANSEAGIGISESKADTALSGFFTSVARLLSSMGGSCGGVERLAGPYSGMPTSHESAHPIGIGSGNLNRIVRRKSMSHSKGAPASVSPTLPDQLLQVITELYEVSYLAEFLCTSAMRVQDTQQGEFSLSPGESSALISLMQTLTDRMVKAATNLEEIRFDLQKEVSSHE